MACDPASSKKKDNFQKKKKSIPGIHKIDGTVVICPHIFTNLPDKTETPAKNGKTEIEDSVKTRGSPCAQK